MSSAKKIPAVILTLTEIALMSRRPLVLLLVVVSSFVLSACADLTAPHKDGCSGYIDMSGECVPTK
jgi:hypothetical protein